MAEQFKLQTNISQAFWCTPKGDFENAKIPSLDSMDVSWFDRLFDGGIHLPDMEIKENEKPAEPIEGKPLTFLISGPPGSGKSSLALEICYQLTRCCNIKNNPNKGKGLFSLYLSTETCAIQLKKNALSLGWPDAENRIAIFDKKNKPTVPVVTLWGIEKLEGGKGISKIVEIALKDFRNLLRPISFGQLLRPLISLIRIIALSIFRKNILKKYIIKITPDILVIDSLNIYESDKQKEFFKQFFKSTTKGPKIIFFVLDSHGIDDYWRYKCDNIVRLDYEYQSDYYIRTIEIIKARYQSHVWGKHQLKIYPFQKNQEASLNDIKKKRLAHPYLKKGGIFIFPSIHYHLSLYKRIVHPERPEPAETKLEDLNRILNGGLPEARCTALIGVRGGHKSHLGYLHLLYRIIEKGESGLIISLRDDEGTTEKTMSKIMKQEFPDEKQKLNEFEASDRLEILYYPPGKITSNEFFHRMFMSIHRLKQKGKKLTVLFNSLDQLSARFPILSNEELFIPVVIESLSGEGITSIIVAVEEPGQPPEQYGLLPMANLILSFKIKEFPFHSYYNNINEYRKLESVSGKKLPSKINEIKDNLSDSTRSSIVLQVERFAGGQRAGKSGLLELVDESEKDEILKFLYNNEPGLHFTPLDSKHSPGEVIRQGN